MVSIKVRNLSLQYRAPERLSLALVSQKTSTLGGVVFRNGRNHYVQALNNISFELNPGDRLGLVGSNGAGKTTLLKVLYGIYQPTGGQVSVVGRVDALFNIRLGFRSGVSGRRNIELRGLINGWSLPRIRESINEIIEFSELGDFIDMPLKTYSQGMAARLAFAVATAMNPEILLMDEWIGAGDPAFQEKASVRMDDLAKRAGIIVLASHNHKLIRNTCTKVMHLEKGVVSEFVHVEDWKG